MVAVVEDVPRLRDGLGIPVPPGVAASFDTPAEHPIEDLVVRWARTHGPFVASTLATRYGLGRAVVEATCEALTASGTLASGEFSDRDAATGMLRVGAGPPPVLPRQGPGSDQAPYPRRPPQGGGAGRADRVRPFPAVLAGRGCGEPRHGCGARCDRTAGRVCAAGQRDRVGGAAGSGARTTSRRCWTSC